MENHDRQSWEPTGHLKEEEDPMCCRVHLVDEIKSSKTNYYFAYLATVIKYIMLTVLDPANIKLDQVKAARVS